MVGSGELGERLRRPGQRAIDGGWDYALAEKLRISSSAKTRRILSVNGGRADENLSQRQRKRAIAGVKAPRQVKKTFSAAKLEVLPLRALPPA